MKCILCSAKKKLFILKTNHLIMCLDCIETQKTNPVFMRDLIESLGLRFLENPSLLYIPVCCACFPMTCSGDLLYKYHTHIVKCCKSCLPKCLKGHYVGLYKTFFIQT